MTIGEVLPYGSLLLTILALGGTLWKWSAIITNMKASIKACDVDSENKFALQQKDIDNLLGNKSTMWEKLNDHDKQLNDMGMILATIQTNTKNMGEALKRIESKIK